ncbi:elongation factor P hydroxylase, partial [Acinetobacter baumannii]|uniref:elongation factor P hydroxylase n=1 Tax=Acinetobacter baumannii TaxID=470 RepID=UPI000AB436A7
RKFRVSIDNLTGDGGDGRKFKDNVYAQIKRYFSGEAKLPADADRLIECICQCTPAGAALKLKEFKRELLDEITKKLRKLIAS